MSFTSFEFVQFLIISLICYYAVPKKVQWVSLLLSSWTFYFIGGGETILWLFTIILVTYLGAILLAKQNSIKDKLPKDDKIAHNKITQVKKFIVLIVCVICIGILGVMKYLNFFLDIFNSSMSRVDLIMPLGLSFFIFQSISYVVDIYRNKYVVQKNIFKYALFVSFFPQIIQGPISRYNQLSENLYKPVNIKAENIQLGIQLAMWGYFKKLVIADRCIILVNEVIIENTPFGGAIVAFSMLFYCIQLYCDFSGGIDISIGIARMFNICLPENFNSPIFATSLTDFWRRWHITLGSFMKDYLFYPMSLSKPFGKISRVSRKYLKGRLGKIFATSLITFIIYFVIGIWHGANFRFIAFGLYNGIIITSSLLLEGLFVKARQIFNMSDKSIFWNIFRITRTSLIVFFGRYLTRAPRLLVAFELIRITFTKPNIEQLFDGTLLSFALTFNDYMIILFGVISMLIYEFYREYIGKFGDLVKKNIIIEYLFIFIPIVLIIMFGIYREGYISSEFIYQQY